MKVAYASHFEYWCRNLRNVIITKSGTESVVRNSTSDVNKTTKIKTKAMSMQSWLITLNVHETESHCQLQNTHFL